MSTIVRTEKYQRSIFGQLVKWSFIAFNVLMLIWLVGGLGAVSNIQTQTAAERAGHVIGATLGFSIIVGIWLAGAVILGLFVLLTRGTKVIVEDKSYSRDTDDMFSSSDTTKADELIALYKDSRRNEGAQAVTKAALSTAVKGFGLNHE